MAEADKVLWSEGLFLRPQHFQQQDRATEALLRGVLQASHLQPWGFRTLSLDAALLGMSELVVGNAGDTVAQTVTMEPEATTLGLMAMLMDPSGRTWSATVPTPPGAMVTANATLRPSGLAVTTGG